VRYAFIANPISGRGRALRVARAVREGLLRAGHAADLLVTARGGDATRFAAESVADVLVACGGDGTVNEVVRGSGAARPIGIVPAGVGNVVAKEFRMPRSAAAIVRSLLALKTRTIDLGFRRHLDGPDVPERPFVFMVSAGFDAEIVKRVTAARTGPLHLATYFFSSFGAVAAADRGRLRVLVDGRPVVTGARYAAVANLRSYGGPIRIVGEAIPDDGLLDVLALVEPLRPRFLRLLARAALSGFSGERDAVHARGREIEILPENAAVPCQIDGEVTADLPAQVRVQRAALRLVVP
jgi:diacylglycerol kinase (ATP)